MTARILIAIVLAIAVPMYLLRFSDIKRGNRVDR